MNTTTAAKAPRLRVLAFYGPEAAPLENPTHAIIRKAGEGAVIVSTIDGIVTECPSSARIGWGPVEDATDAQFCGKCGEPMWFGPAVKDVYCRPCYNARAKEIAAERKAETPEAARRRDPIDERLDRVQGALSAAQAKSRADLIAITLRNIVMAADDFAGRSKALRGEGLAIRFAQVAEQYGLTVAQANTLVGTSVPAPTMTAAEYRKATRKAAAEDEAA